MARKIIFPIKMKHNIYTQDEFKERFMLKKYSIDNDINSLLVRPIVHQKKPFYDRTESSSNNQIYYNKTIFLKPILRDEKSYTEYKILKPNKIKYLNNVKNFNFINMGSGSGSYLSSASCMILGINFCICGYGLDLI